MVEGKHRVCSPRGASSLTAGGAGDGTPYGALGASTAHAGEAGGGDHGGSSCWDVLLGSQPISRYLVRFSVSAVESRFIRAIDRMGGTNCRIRGPAERGRGALALDVKRGRRLLGAAGKGKGGRGHLCFPTRAFSTFSGLYGSTPQ